MRFLNEIDKFKGTGITNAKGKDLETFLDEYDPFRYQTPSVTADMVVFSYEEDPFFEIKENKLEILMVKRKNHPEIGLWALPGGFANIKEDLNVTANRELQEETGIENLRAEQFATYGDWKRDPRTRVITVCYLALVEKNLLKIKAGDDAQDAQWFELSLVKYDTEEADKDTKQYFTLTLSNQNKNTALKAKVKATKTKGLIQSWAYEVIGETDIAFDHAAIITQAFNVLKQRALDE